jgi:hypothetical protein
MNTIMSLDPISGSYIWTYFNNTPGEDWQPVLEGQHTQLVRVEKTGEDSYSLTLGSKELTEGTKTDGMVVTGLPYIGMDYPETEPVSNHIAVHKGSWDKTVEVPFLGAISISREGYLLFHESDVTVSDLDIDVLNWAYDDHLCLVPREYGYLDVVLVLGDKMVVHRSKESNPGYHFNKSLRYSIDMCPELYHFSLDNDLAVHKNLLNAPKFPLKGLLVALSSQLSYIRFIKGLKRSEIYKYLKFAKKWLDADLPPLQKQSKKVLQDLVLSCFPDSLPEVLDLNYRDMQIVLKAYREVKGGVGRLQMSCSRIYTMFKELFGSWESNYNKLVTAAKSFYSTVEDAKSKLSLSLGIP